MGKMLVSVMNGHVTGTPTFFVDPSMDPKKHQLTLNVTVNGPKKKDGTRDADTIACKIWGKYGAIAAHQLDNGSGVNIIGELKTWKRDTGKVDAAGKKIFEEKVSIRVDNFFHTGATGKEEIALVQKNIAAFNAAKALGQIHPAADLTPEIMLKKPEPTVVPDFNILVSAKTGKYGYAKVWTKDRGFIGPQNAAAIAASAPVTAMPASFATDFAKLTEMVKTIAAAQAANAAQPIVAQPELAPAGAAEAARAKGVDGFEGA